MSSIGASVASSLRHRYRLLSLLAPAEYQRSGAFFWSGTKAAYQNFAYDIGAINQAMPPV